MSLYLFAVYIDEIVCKVEASGTGCYVGLVCFSVILHTDDILLLAPTTSPLQKFYQLVNMNWVYKIWPLTSKMFPVHMYWS